jgi:MurNAc alpha-1-phosphate uridylyltransferase
MSPPLATAMVLAAGLGRRMRHLSERTPKPLVRVGGRTLLDRVLDELAAGGVTRAVVNVHYRADEIESHLALRRAGGHPPTLEVSDERAALLDTGGALVKARPALGPGPILVANSDVVRGGTVENAARALARRYDAARMDMLLLLYPVARAIGFEGPGDFFLDDDARPRRRADAATAPFLFAGLYVIDPMILAAAPKGAFSANWLFDRAIERGRLFGHVFDGRWLHVGSPESFAAAEATLADG